MNTKQTKAQAKAADKQEAIGHLRKYLSPGSRVYTALKSVSSSGMSRRIECYIPAVINADTGELGIINISHYVARALDRNRSDTGILCQGCGMDMGFELVYSLSWELFRSDFDSYHDASYALTQSWI